MRARGVLRALRPSFLLALVAGFVLVSGVASAQVVHWLAEEPEKDLGRGAPLVSEKPEAELNLWDRYLRFWNAEIEKVSRLDPYGVTSQLPTGYLSIKWQWDTITAGSRYNNKRELGPVFPPIEFSIGGQKELSFDMGLSGKGGGHTFQISYGITDPLDWYIEIPFMYIDVKFNPETLPVDEEGNTIGPTAAALFGVQDRKAFSGRDIFCQVLPMLGRSTPMTGYKDDWILGDINTGFSWNIFRTSRMSGALTARVFLPTGHVADPDKSLFYGTGPELEVGLGGWATSATMGYDFRIFKYSYWIDIIASTEVTAGYAFEQHRDYPKKFVTPDPMAQNLDPVSFPDLTHLKGTYSYTPGFSMSWYAKLGIQVALFGFEAGYGVAHAQEPELKGDPTFVRMVRALELLGQQTTWAVQLGASINLAALYIPVDVGFTWKKVVDGYNSLVFDDWYQVVVKAYIPIFPKSAPVAMPPVDDSLDGTEEPS